MSSLRPLTILQVAAPGVAGGLESVLLELTGGLRRLGHRVVLVVVLDPDSTESAVTTGAAELGVEVVSVVVPARAYLREYRRLREAIAAIKPDVVHTHGYRADLIAGRAARRAGVPWVSTAHGFIGGDRKNRLYEWLQGRSFRRADAVIAVSAPLREQLHRAGVATCRVHLLRNAIAPRPRLSREAARARLGATGEGPLIGWVGRLTHEKGADLFVAALARIAHRAWTASVLGDGADRAALEAQARALGIDARIRWHGVVANAAALFPAFDAWVLSSRTEGTPIALLEAMAAGVPAVVTAVGGVPDVVSLCEALLVAPENAGALAEALETLLAHPADARRRAEAAQARLRAEFDPARWLEAHVQRYRALMAPTPAEV